MSTVLVVVPDYASHYFPLSAVGHALRQRHHRVVVATGPGLRAKVEDDGFDHRELVLGPGSNAGVIRPAEQRMEEETQLNAFFAASREGAVPTLLHQARNRLRDLLWQPGRVATDLASILEEVDPDAVLADHLAFGATATLRGLGRSFFSFHPGHPSVLTSIVPYGYPPRLPDRLRVDPVGLRQLHAVCVEVVGRFTDEYNRAMAALDPSVEPVGNAFTAVSRELTLINYPVVLGGRYRMAASSRFIGSSVRPQELTPEWSDRLAGGGARPRVMISLGSFFSVRSDLLRKLVEAFHREPVQVILASGHTPIEMLGDLPEHWVVEPYLPQPALLPHCDLVVTHGGNNTVTEALTAGVPLLVGPLSTDQFAGGADVEEAGLGRVFDPNFDDASGIPDLAREVLEGPAVERVAALGSWMRANPGRELAAGLVEAATDPITADSPLTRSATR
jgi:UDP:flavonoid glycosyltransferase YjiC (YdhE family)